MSKKMIKWKKKTEGGKTRIVETNNLPATILAATKLGWQRQVAKK